MEDQEFIERFEACTLPAENFHHEQHVRVVWLYLQRYPVLETLNRFSESLKRFATANGFVGDMIYDERLGIDPRKTFVDPGDPTRQKQWPKNAEPHDLLVPVMREGQIAGETEALAAIRARATDQVAKLHPGIRRFMNPHEYPVGIDIGLHQMRDQMIRQMLAPSATAGE